MAKYCPGSRGHCNAAVRGCDATTPTAAVGPGTSSPNVVRQVVRPSPAERIGNAFWAAIAKGLISEDAAVASLAVGSRWFRHSDSMPSVSQAPLSGRYLSFVEREEIARLRARGCGVRAIARRLDHSPSTISRELRRNAATRDGSLDYRASTAQWHADRRAPRPKRAKLAVNDALRHYVQDRLAGTVTKMDGTRLVGPALRWIGRRRGRIGCTQFWQAPPRPTTRQEMIAFRTASLAEVA
jgi:transposase-like protein